MSSVVFFCLYAVNGTACAALGTLFMEMRRRPIHNFMAFATMALGGLVNIVALGYAPQPLISALDGFVVFFGALFDGTLRDVKAWSCVAAIVVGCIIVVASSTRHVSNEKYNARVDASLILGTMLGISLITQTTSVHAAAPGVMGGFTQTMAKAFDIAMQTKRGKLKRAYGLAMLVFSATQALLLWRALLGKKAMQVNPVYIVVLNIAGTAMGILVYEELEVSKLPPFMLGYVMMCVGSYWLYVRD